MINGLKKFNKIVLVGTGMFLMGLGMFMLNFLFSFKFALISCVIWTIGGMTFLGIVQFICYEAANQKKKGQIMGFYQAISAFGKVIGPIIGGYIYYSFGANLLWSLIMIVGTSCLLICFNFRKYDLIRC